MVDETQGSGGVGRGAGAPAGETGAPAGGASDAGVAAEPVVEDNGPWFVVFITVFIFLFASAFAFLVHSLLVTFGTGVAGAETVAVAPVEVEAEDSAPNVVELRTVGLRFEGPDSVPAARPG
ncbi:MAG: hypothetical protein ACODAA_02115 [Gemmatimonadota bacterium]